MYIFIFNMYVCINIDSYVCTFVFIYAYKYSVF